MAPKRTTSWLLAAGVLTSALTNSVHGYRWPSPQYDALEGLLYEGTRRDGSNLASIQHPCKNRPGSQASIGAEWLRLAYHDVATHNSETGTGGLDASIAFELDRPENFGRGMHDTIEDFATFSSKYISRADVIAIGTTLAIASCGGPILPLRGGRVDAQFPDVAGVPESHQDLDAHTEIFRRQGFTKEEMIGLVACGHAWGGVRSSDFPAVVPPGDDPEVDEFKMFDDTKEFDNHVVTQYNDGTTLNPLVVDANVTMNSDQRIFASDGNATMRRLNDPEEFASTCRTLLSRMLDVVPANVTLTEEIQLIPAKVTDAHLTIEKDEFLFKVSLRLARPADAKGPLPTAKLLWCDRYGDNKDCAKGTGKSASTATTPRAGDLETSPVTFRASTRFVYYTFVAPVSPEESVSKFWFEVTDKNEGTKAKVYDNEGDGYRIAQDAILYVPRQTTVTLGGETMTEKVFQIVAAVKTANSPSRVFLSAFDNAMPAFGPPVIAEAEMAINRTMPSMHGYDFYTGSVEDHGAQLTVDLHAVVGGETFTEDYMQTFLVAGRAPYTPPTNVTTLSLTPPSPKDSSSASESWDSPLYTALMITLGLVLSLPLIHS